MPEKAGPAAGSPGAQQLADHLTGLPSRRALASRLQELAAEKEPFGLLFVELSGLAELNRRAGAAGGDRALMEFARLLSGILREADAFFRYGGDQFVVVSPGLRPGKEVGPGKRILRETEGSCRRTGGVRAGAHSRRASGRGGGAPGGTSGGSGRPGPDRGDRPGGFGVMHPLWNAPAGPGLRPEGGEGAGGGATGLKALESASRPLELASLSLVCAHDVRLPACGTGLSGGPGGVLERLRLYRMTRNPLPEAGRRLAMLERRLETGCPGDQGGEGVR